MKRIVLLMLILCIQLWGNEIIEYENKLLKVFEIGNAPNQFAIFDAGPWGYQLTTNLRIGANNRLYISDWGNRRYNEYDVNLNFKRSIVHDGISDIKSYVSPNGYVYSYSYGFHKASPQGELLFSVKIDLPKGYMDKLTGSQYGEYSLFYDDKNRTPVVLTPEGKRLSAEETKAFQKKLRTTSSLWHDKRVQDKLNEYLDRTQLFYFEDKLYFEKKNQYLGYISVIQNALELGGGSYPSSTGYRGSDIHGNTYFKIYGTGDTDYFYVFDKYGNAIAKMIDNLKENVYIGLNGDIYNSYGDKKTKTVYFHRITNTWDSIPQDEVEAWVKRHQAIDIDELVAANQPEIVDLEIKKISLTKPTIKTLTTTSTLTEPNDKNAWQVGSSASCSPMQPNHPIKAFDNNPKTMWIEAAKGPGLGEYLEVELSSPITIDGIQIQPGCFWDTYWKQNNRVRQMTIFFDDEKYILNFQDVMKHQGVSFKQSVTFTKAKFVINDVYKTTNWDDTAISDIWFLKEGKPIELGLGEYAGVLK